MKQKKLIVWAIVDKHGRIPRLKRAGDIMTPLVFFKKQWAQNYDLQDGEVIREVEVTIRDLATGEPINCQ